MKRDDLKTCDTLMMSLPLHSASCSDPTYPENLGLQGLHEVYAYVSLAHDNGVLDEAEALFRQLCVFDFKNVDYLLGLSAVYRLLGEHQKALDLNAVAMTLRDDAPPQSLPQC
jgi:hypothetical protein